VPDSRCTTDRVLESATYAALENTATRTPRFCLTIRNITTRIGIWFSFLPAGNRVIELLVADDTRIRCFGR
jgi:hypothetical protein